jgi:hypothetical protein
MDFRLSAYPSAVARILSLDGDGLRAMPLVPKACASPQARTEIRKWKARELFPHALSPEGAMIGLYLYYSCNEEAHAMAQDLNTAEGNFWHGIVHRQEPDAVNSGYWFRQVVRHAIFPALREEAARLGFPAGNPPASTWDPMAFIDYCESARARPGSDEAHRPGSAASASALCAFSSEEHLAMQVQLVEWQLLFDYCAREKTR